MPKTYNANKSWPLVVFISPSDNPAGWNAWKKTCQEHGLLFCAPFGAGNSCPIGQRVRIVLDMLDDVRRHYSIDPEQTYITGFSGGGRMACSIGFALPEYFGGVARVCGINPLPSLTYQRQRVHDRLSVAFVTGEDDFNRKENEVYLYPQFQELGIRAKLWVVPKSGDTMPEPAVLSEVYQWLAADVKRRCADVAAQPLLSVTAQETPTAAQQAERFVEAARANLKKADRTWQGVALLQGVQARWPKTAAATKAGQTLKEVLKNDQLLQRIEEQGGADERRFLLSQAKALQRFGKRDLALRTWQQLQIRTPNRSRDGWPRRKSRSCKASKPRRKGRMEWWWLAAIVLLAGGLLALAWRPLRRFGQAVQVERARELFQLQRPRLEALFMQTASATGKPRACAGRRASGNLGSSLPANGLPDRSRPWWASPFNSRRSRAAIWKTWQRSRI